MRLVRTGIGSWPVEVIHTGTAAFGRGLAATRDIAPGEVILEESPLAMLTFYEYKAVFEAMGPESRNAIFGHDAEWGKRFFAWDDPELVNIPEKEEDKPKKKKIPQDQSHVAYAKLSNAIIGAHPEFASKPNYFQTAVVGSDDDIRAMKLLAEHLQKRDPSMTDSTEKDQREKILQARLWGVLVVNCIVISPLLSKINAGIGFFPAFSMVNHRCNPPADVFFSEGKLRMVAVREIKAGEDVEYDYLNGICVMQERRLRQSALLTSSRFECRCPECRSTQDIILQAWTAEGIKKVGTKNTSKSLDDVYRLANDSLVFRSNFIRAFKEFGGELMDHPVVFLNLCRQLATANSMVKDQTDCDTVGQILLSGILCARDPTQFFALLPGNIRRNIRKLMLTLHSGHLFNALKPILVGFAETKPEDLSDVLQKTSQFFSEMDPERREALLRLIIPDLEYLGTRGFDSLFIDCAVNPMIRAMPEVLRIIKPYADQMEEMIRQESQPR
jgi:hypothetical protein